MSTVEIFGAAGSGLDELLFDCVGDVFGLRESTEEMVDELFFDKILQSGIT